MKGSSSAEENQIGARKAVINQTWRPSNLPTFNRHSFELEKKALVSTPFRSNLNNVIVSFT